MTTVLSMNIKRCYYFAGLCMLATATASAETPLGTLVDRIAAKVDNQIILQSELEIAAKQYLQQGAQETPNLKCEVLRKLILDKALLTKAKQDGVGVTKKQLTQQLDQTIQYWMAQAGSEKALVQSLGKPIAEIKNDLRERVREQMTIDEARRKVAGSVSVTPKEVKSFFKSLSSQARPLYPTEVVVRQIVQYPQVGQQEKEAVIAQLKALKLRLQNGESFEKLAQEYSQDPGSAPHGGGLGFWRPGELAAAYEATALALQPGEVSEPVETQFGFHLIQLIARENSQYNSRHILLKPNPEVLDIEVAKASLAKLRTSILTGKCTFEEAAKNSSDDTATALVGGLLTGKRGEIQMTIDELPSDIFFVVEQLASGSISEPVEFTASGDKKATRILLVEEKIPAHQANLTQDYEKIKRILIEKKRASAFQTWLEAAQASVSITVAPEYQNCELLK